MLKQVAAALLSSALLALPAHAAVKPQIQWDKQYDFSNVKTFKWQPPAAASRAETEPFMHQFIQDASRVSSGPAPKQITVPSFVPITTTPSHVSRR